jgi:hypothetical protein
MDTLTGYIAVVVAAVLAAVSVGLSAFGRGPKWVRRMTEAWLAPHDAKPYPDMPIMKVIARRCPELEKSMERDDNPPSGEYERAGEMLKELRQQARLGRLTVWGRLNATSGHEEHTPLSEIAADFWEKGSIGYMEFLKDGKGQADRRKPNGDKEWYDDLRFNERQVVRLYPAQRQQLKLQKPWKRVQE